jgi:hypothetical protein
MAENSLYGIEESWRSPLSAKAEISRLKEGSSGGEMAAAQLMSACLGMWRINNQ